MVAARKGHFMDHLLLYALAAFIVGMSKGGLATAGALAVPLLSLWMDPLVAAAFLLPIFITSDAVGVFLYRKEFSRPNLMVMIPAGLIGVILATFLAPYMSISLAKFLTGMIGISFCLQVFFRMIVGNVTPRPFSMRRGVFWGILTGITSFMSHNGAPPFQAFVLPQKLPKMDFAGTTTITFAAVNLFKLPAYGAVGLMSGFDLKAFAWMAVVAGIGAVVGRRLTMVLPDRVYIGFIQVSLFAVSVYLVAQSVMVWL